MDEMQSYDATAIQQKRRSVSESEKNRGGAEEHGESEGGKITEQGSAGGLTTVLIYALIDPVTNEIRYIGKTASTLSHRLAQHLRSGNNTHRAAWIKSIPSGLKPIIEEIDRVENSNDMDWQEVERFWISYLRFLGCRLTNLEIGGIGGIARPSETREKIGNANRGRVHSSATREKFRLAHLGKKLTAEHCANMSRAVTGKKLGPRPRELVERIAVLLRGQKKPRTAEHQAKLTQLQIGKRRSPETRAKISAAQVGKKRGPYSPDRIAKSVAGMTAESRKKMSKASLRRWAGQKAYDTA